MSVKRVIPLTFPRRSSVRWSRGCKAAKAHPFLTETATLYKGQRSDAIVHLNHAYNHGFTPGKVGAPFIMADGLSGNAEVGVDIDGVHHSRVFIAREAVYADALIAVSHVTAHMESGIGACLKNLGMGLASRKGKMRQHSSINPDIDEEKCTLCGQCIEWCPEDAIVEEETSARIIMEKCIGCGECLTVCNFDAVTYNWGMGSVAIQEHIAEHALGAVSGKKGRAFFINGLFDMTKDCDCIPGRQQAAIPDIGFLASTDPVALDQATLDMTDSDSAEGLVRSSWPHLDPNHQLAHAEKIGLGTRQYNLVTL